MNHALKLSQPPTPGTSLFVSPSALLKRYYVQYNVGRCKYLVNFHDGVKTHNDGSPFYDIRIFKNQPTLQACLRDLVNQGYKERNWLS